ncbi:MAG: ATP-binding protein [Pseudomonadota bacterium]
MDPLVATAIHDAKNALLALDIQLAEAERRPAETDFRTARGTVARIAGQLSELLTLYRAGNGQLRLAIDDHDLNDFLDDLLAELGPLPAGIALDVDREAATRLGAWAFDAYLVKLALLDALRNCLRHARQRVTLALSAPPEGGIRFAVGDDGPGFPADLLAGGEPLQSAQGTGLGLSFVRLIAERHATPAGRRGRVELANDGGAVLRLTLP